MGTEEQDREAREAFAKEQEELRAAQEASGQVRGTTQADVDEAGTDPQAADQQEQERAQQEQQRAAQQAAKKEPTQK